MIEAIVAAALRAILVSCVLGAALFAVVALVVRTVSLDATIRHALWTLALCATAVMPLGALAVSAARSTSAHADAAIAAPGSSSSSSLRAHTMTTSAQSAPAAAAPTGSSGAHSAYSAALSGWQPHPNRIAAIGIVGIWIAGALAGLAGLFLSLRRVQGLKKRSSPLDAELAAELPWLTENTMREREIYLRLSYEIETPVAVGFRRPVILIPTELATTGGLAAIEGLILHEHAHLRRYDDWTNLAQRVIERLFWFNPLVWVLGRRIALEREIAADDAVVEVTGRPGEYAQSLWQLAREMRMPEHSVVAPGALLTRKQISVRIEALLERRPVLKQWRPIAALIGLTAIGCTVAAAASAPGIELPKSVSPVALAALHHARVAFSEPPPVIHEPNVAGGSTRTRPPRVTLAPPVLSEQTIASTVSTSMRAASAAVAALAGQERVARAEPTAPPSATPPKTNDSTESALNAKDVSGSNLSGRDLRGSDFRGLTIKGTNFEGADLRGSHLDGARLIGVNLADARLDGASLTNATLTGTNIEGTTFGGANTTGLRIIGASFAGMDLRDLDVRTLLSACTACDLRGANLRNADLHGARLIGANLADADLRGANLRGAILTGADLQSANLEHADLRDASLDGCSLADANLRGADTTGAHFHGSDLSNTQD